MKQLYTILILLLGLNMARAGWGDDLNRQLNSKATTNFVNGAVTNLGNSVAVTMTNAANKFTGTFTNGTFYGNGAGLTNVTGTGGATNAIANLNGFGTNTTLVTLSSPVYATNLVVTGTLSPNVAGTYTNIANYGGEPAFERTDGAYYIWFLNAYYVLSTNASGVTPVSTNAWYSGFVTNPDTTYSPHGTNTGTATATYSIITNSFASTNINFSSTNGGTFIGTFAGNGSGLTNLNVTGSGITNLLATNAILPSVSGLVGFIPTNSASGSSVTTNQFASTNYVIAATNNLGNTVAVTMTNVANQFSGSVAGELEILTNATTPAGVNYLSIGQVNHGAGDFLRLYTNLNGGGRDIVGFLGTVDFSAGGFGLEPLPANGSGWSFQVATNLVDNMAELNIFPEPNGGIGFRFYTNGVIGGFYPNSTLSGEHSTNLAPITITNGIYYGNGGGLTNLNYSNITNQPALVTLVTATNISSNMVYLGTNGLGAGGISLTQATNVALPTATNVFNGLIIGATNNLLPTMTNIATAVGGGISAVTATNIASNIVLNATNNFKVVVTNTALVSATNVVNALVSGATFSIQVENQGDKNNYTLYFVNGMLSSYTQP